MPIFAAERNKKMKKTTTNNTSLNNDSDFEHLKVWQDIPDLDYYLSEQNWNFHVNQMLHKSILVFYEGQELGAFLEVSHDTFGQPIKDYTHKYGRLFNEAYRLCRMVLTSPVPETKIAQFAMQAATWKFRNMKDENGKTYHLIPNVTDLIESYHILGMVNTILIFANDQTESVDRFLVALSVYKDEGLPFKGYIHCFDIYNEVYKAFILTTIVDGTYLRPGYDYKAKDEYLRKNLPWYNSLAKELDKKMKEAEAKKRKDSAEANMEQTVLDKISANNIDYYYEGWRCGKAGAITQEKGIYRFIEMTRGSSGMLHRVHDRTQDNPVVAIGIVAYWLIFKQGKDIVLQKLTKYTSIPQSMKEMFELYTQQKFQLFKEQNRDNVQLDVPADLYQMVSTATGFTTDNITILAYRVPQFVDAESTSSKGFTDYLPIILAVVIFGLLAFVVFKSTRPVEVLETEPELSVEALLASTKENQQPVEDIDLNDKSETRKAIEKFVDENPEAVALLLRNWLEDDWN